MGAEVPLRESRRWTAGLVDVEVEAEAEAEVASGWSACSAEACSSASGMSWSAFEGSLPCLGSATEAASGTASEFSAGGADSSDSAAFCAWRSGAFAPPRPLPLGRPLGAIVVVITSRVIGLECKAWPLRWTGSHINLSTSEFLLSITLAINRHFGEIISPKHHYA
jgi:hypothetical protein